MGIGDMMYNIKRVMEKGDKMHCMMNVFPFNINVSYFTSLIT
jgi:hypothetical protein